MVHVQNNINSLDDSAYFTELVFTHYPILINEMELFKDRMMYLKDVELPHLFIDKLIAEFAALSRAEKHYWESDLTEQTNRTFPKNYIVQKQKTISELISHLRSLLFGNKNENRQEVLSVLSNYVDIEYKLTTIFIEKEKRIHELIGNEPNTHEQ